jgi:hypothetical protein
MKKIIFATLAVVIAVYLIYRGYERVPSDSWKEYKKLVKVWPSLKNEKIKSVIFTSFTSASPYEHEKYLKKPFKSSGFRVIAANIVEEWLPGCEIPKEKLPEYVEIMDRAVENAQKRGWGGCSTSPDEGKMLIVTERGKYIFCINGEIPEVAGGLPIICGGDWVSNELGRLFTKCCRPDLEYKYELPPKEKVVAVLLYLPKYSPPLALFGDKLLAEKVVFETKFPDNGGNGELVRLMRLRKFGMEINVEDKEIIIGKSFEPKRVFEGRDWLEKIMDAYEDALKEAKEKGKYYPCRPDPFNARIVFMTEERDCWKELGIDANSVFDDYVKSEQLKEYFDELGLTKELLAGAKPSTAQLVGEPNKTPQN